MTTSLQVLDNLFPGVAVLNPEQIARALGKGGPGGTKTIQNQISAGRFPVRVVRVGRLWLCPKAALAAYLDGTAPPLLPEQVPEEPRRRRGRPTNAERELRATRVFWGKVGKILMDQEARQMQELQRQYDEIKDDSDGQQIGHVLKLRLGKP